ncbi:MAG: thiol-disulfide oxidoreductase DCC family protein [Acidobacteriota bacterium]|nr:thiol-disulfide oxidoreductase DCC family protein [Acidobacteriota bacterium]MDH3530801.1 thiol-disulfide oxidoreductase DCC family protein [Acidobacteriota bacterium]
MENSEHAVVLFDGVCNLCNSSVNFIIERDSRDRFRFASLQSDFGREMLQKHSLDRDETDSVVLIENGTAFVYSTAALRIARRLDGLWPAAFGLVIVPVFVRDFFYKLIAKNRYRIFGKRDVCRMPTPDDARKFI